MGKGVKGSCEGTSYLPNWTLERENLECFNRRKWLENVWNMETSTVMCCRPSVCVFKNKVNHKQQIRLELHLNVWLSLVVSGVGEIRKIPCLTFPTTNVCLTNELPTAEHKTWKVPDKQIQEVLSNGGFRVYMLSLEYLKAQQIRHQYQICSCFPGSNMMIATMHWLSLSLYHVKSIFYNLIYCYRERAVLE